MDDANIGNLSLTLANENFKFHAAHFMAYVTEDNKVVREPLHGHNYHVKITVNEVQNNEHYSMINFEYLSSIVKPICDEIDNHMLIPVKSKALDVSESNGHVTVKIVNTKYKFVVPKTDCYLLPLEASSCEAMSKYISEKITKTLREKTNLNSIVVEVGEIPHLSARREISFRAKL